MKKYFAAVLLILLACNSLLHAQDADVFKKWDDSVIMKANTGVNAEFLSEDEKKVLLYTNLARADGPLFAETFLKQYIILKELKPNNYIRSLQRDLQNVKDLAMLLPEQDLYRVAREHATRSGIKGSQGHKGFKARYEPMMEKYMEIGENIYYGQYTPAEIVFQLLIDEGIEDLGHRINLLNPRFNSLGVSIKPHKTFEYNCVMSFGYLTRTYKDFVQ